jgi:hypothetical protein
LHALLNAEVLNPTAAMIIIQKLCGAVHALLPEPQLLRSFVD